MNATAVPAANLYLVVGYDGSPPAVRALDGAARLLVGRPGSIEVLYVAHLPSLDMLSPDAVAEMEVNFDDIARELHDQASEQLSGREENPRPPPRRHRGDRGRELIARHAPHGRLGRRQPRPPFTGAPGGRALAASRRWTWRFRYAYGGLR